MRPPSSCLPPAAGDRLGATDVPGIQLWQGLLRSAPRCGQHQLDGGPVLPGLLRDLGKIGNGKPLALKCQVIQRPPGSVGHVIGELHLGAGSGAGLNGRGHLGKRDRMACPVFRVGQALLGSFEFPVGGAPARTDFAAAPKRARSVGASRPVPSAIRLSSSCARVAIVPLLARKLMTRPDCAQPAGQ